MQCKNCNTYFNPSTLRQVYCTTDCCTEYNRNNRKKFNLICKNCNVEFYTKHKVQKYCGLKCSGIANSLCHHNIFTKEKYCEMGKKSRTAQLKGKILLKDTIRECLYCKKSYTPRYDVQKYCGRECSQTHVAMLIKNGTINTNTNNRGKGEIYFADLCIEHFGDDDIICNEKMFKDKNGGLWDADIIIKSLKLCVLYDGIFHFKQVKKQMNLTQIRSRDKLKRHIIIRNGYTYYTVKDLGKFNKQFVINEFNLFIHKLQYNIVLRQMLINNHKSLFNQTLDNLASKINLISI